MASVCELTNMPPHGRRQREAVSVVRRTGTVAVMGDLPQVSGLHEGLLPPMLCR